MFKYLIGLAVSAALAAGATHADTETTDDWRRQGQESLMAALQRQANTGRAKNIILFIGDGNGVATVTATRIFDGQSRGMSGEENILSYERFPYLALAKTYNTNQQTPDSAGTMTAIMTGVKTRAGVIAQGPEVPLGDCRGHPQALPTLLEEARAAGKAVGLVTTTRVTHATPAATFAHAAHRDWEADTDLPVAMKSCGRDIARQLIENGPIDVVMGGGRQQFLSTSIKDPEYPRKKGVRGDGRNLIAEWQTRHPDGLFVWNRRQFDAIPVNFKGKILALFEPSHMAYEADRVIDNADEPSLAEMTAKAIDQLQRGPHGFFLMVEEGRIDHAHHAGNAYRALTEGRELSRAVQVAVEKVGVEDSLIIVTADHSHTFTLAGYPTRGNPILGQVIGNDRRGNAKTKPELAADGRPYTTLGYINGPGHGHFDNPEARYYQPPTGGRYLSLGEKTLGKDFHQESLVPLASETHGGEDVAIYAIGPWAHLFQGVQEQSYIYQVMKHALTAGAAPESSLQPGE